MMVRRLASFVLLCSTLAGCYDSSEAGCDPALAAGEPCEGAWTCPATSLEGSTAVHFRETRCEAGVVRERAWSVPYGAVDGGAPRPEAGALDAGAIDAGAVDAGAIDVLDAGVADASAADAGAPADRAGIRCGADTCAAGTEICIACARDGATRMGCVAPAGRSWWDAAWDVDCYGPTTVFVACDGPEDCTTPGETCVFSGGEAAYGQCVPVPAGSSAACHGDGDCPDPEHVCERDGVDALFVSYFGAVEADIGWSPKACWDPFRR